MGQIQNCNLYIVGNWILASPMSADIIKLYKLTEYIMEQLKTIISYRHNGVALLFS